MSRITGGNTKPELIVRKILYSSGYRYRLHDKKLPGKPDIVFRGRKKVIFVHGCFWHGHFDCVRAKRPSTNVDFWTNKIDKNIERDNNNLNKLLENGWSVLVVWQCELRNVEALSGKLLKFMGTIDNQPRVDFL
jgi:DNA mismatch endonuclease (patch repair protein)